MATPRSPLPAMWEVPKVFRQRLRESVGRQRAMSAEGHLLLVLHALPQGDAPQRAARFFWRSPDGTWRSTVGHGIAALQKRLAEFEAAIESLDSAEDGAERSGEFLDILQRIAPLLRSARHLHETLQQAREMIGDDGDLIVCRDQAYALQRRAEIVQSDTQIRLDCAIARRAEEQAEASHQMAVAAHRLNLLAAFFFPLATLCTFFSMNLQHFLDSLTRVPWLFWPIVIASFALGFLIKSLVFSQPQAPGTTRSRSPVPRPGSASPGSPGG